MEFNVQSSDAEQKGENQRTTENRLKAHRMQMVF